MSESSDRAPGKVGLARETTDFGEVAWNEAFGEDVAAAGWNGPAGFETLLAGEPLAAGRGATLACALPVSGGTCIVRRVLRGGLLGGTLGDRLTSPARAFEELRVTAELFGAGAPVVRPVLAAARRRGPFWNAVVGTVLEEDAADVLVWMGSDPDRPRILRAVEACARAIRRFHDAGGRHADLHVKNLLVRERGDACDAVIVDLDGARSGEAPDAARRMKELARLHRSVLKRGLADRIDHEAHRAFLAAYVAGDTGLGVDLGRHWPRERRRVAIHALRYRTP